MFCDVNIILDLSDEFAVKPIVFIHSSTRCVKSARACRGEIAIVGWVNTGGNGINVGI